LTTLDNVVLTPHVAARGVVWDNIDTLFANISRVLRGEAPRDVVT
jgi:phosphoglycerate dehydrogenase-like enzyme